MASSRIAILRQVAQRYQVVTRFTASAPVLSGIAAYRCLNRILHISDVDPESCSSLRGLTE